MAQITLPVGLTWGQYRALLNNNISDVEDRIVDIETGGIQITHGDGPPESGTGNVGDYYIDDTNDDLYGPKMQAGWPDGVSMSGFSHRGMWDSLTAYKMNDVVTHQNSLWIAKAASIGVEPRDAAAEWDILGRGDYFRGNWVSGATYRPQHVARYPDDTGDLYRWISAEGVSNSNPAVDTSNWMLLMPQGAKGDKGDQGDQGVPGPRGLNPRGTWDSVTAYDAEDSVFYEGSYWRAIVDNTNVEPRVANDDTWELIARGVRFRGGWVTATFYRTNDIVTYDGSSYVSVTDHTSGTAPDVDTTNYALLAAKGAQGPSGEDGADGAEGAQGPQGDAGPAGEGVPTGGTQKDVLIKTSSTDYDTEWGMPYCPVYWRVIKSTSQNLGTGATGVGNVVTFDVDSLPVGATHSAGVITVERTGLYRVGVVIGTTSGYSIDTALHIFISVNNDTTNYGAGLYRVAALTGASGKAVQNHGSVIVVLTAGDTVRARAAHTSGMGAVRTMTEDACMFYGEYIGRA